MNIQVYSQNKYHFKVISAAVLLKKHNCFKDLKNPNLVTNLRQPLRSICPKFGSWEWAVSQSTYYRILRTQLAAGRSEGGCGKP